MSRPSPAAAAEQPPAHLPPPPISSAAAESEEVAAKVLGAEALRSLPPAALDEVRSMGLERGRLNAEKLMKLMKAMLLVKHVRQDKVPVEVAPRVWLGSIGAAYNKEFMQANGITRVLSVGASLPQPYKELVTYASISVLDCADEKLSDHFETAFRFIEEGVLADTGTLVHCFAGKSRSTTTVIAWIMATQDGESPDAILSRIQAVRPIVQPNPGFMQQLAEFHQTLPAKGRWRGGCWCKP